MPTQTTLSREERGYGREHKKLRELWKSEVSKGTIRCARCKQAIRPGEPWDLGHVPGDRSRYSGPEHRRCNRATAGTRRRWSSPAPRRSRSGRGFWQNDDRWDVPWLKGLRKVPKDATWPR